jgi:hypothetical protein
VRIPALLLLIICLAGCNSGKKSNDAVRQGVVDYLVGKGFDIPKAMTVSVTSLEMQGSQADMTVAITPAGGNPSQGMSMKYHLEQQGSKWVVVSRPGDAGAHGGGAMPPGPGGAPHGAMPAGAGGAPHGAGGPGAAPSSGGSRMPSPDDLPPAKK